MPVPTPATDMQLRHAVIEVGGHRVHHRYRRDLAPPGRTPVVLLHGYMVSGTYLKPSIRRLAHRFPVYAPDLPGHGKSSKPEAALGIDDLADVLMRWCSRVGLQKVHLVGNSLGCAVATSAALHHPQRVGRLVLQAPTLEPGGRDRFRSFLRGLEHLRRASGNGFEAILWNDYRRSGLRHSLESWRLAIEDRIEERLPKIRHPALVVLGANDPIVSEKWARHVADLLPNGRFRLVPDADHIMVYHDAKRLERLVVPFLLEDDPKGGVTPASRSRSPSARVPVPRRGRRAG